MVSKGLWDRAQTICITMMQGETKRSRAERNFSMIQSVVRDGDTFKILALNKMSADILEREYAEDLKKSFLLAGADPNIKIEFSFDENAKPAIIVPKANTVVEKTKTGRIQTFISTMPLKEYYTFEEFVEGPSNSYVLAAAKGVAKNPGQKGLNPLFIHGGTGLGKTHIMQAIGNEVKRNNPMAAVCYLTAEVFLNEYVNAMTQNSLQTFRDRYRKIDVLLIDDIQFITTNMRNFQEEFFNTFNTLTGADKQIVITSDVAPKDLPGIEERLISRFEGGMLQEIESPAYETRLAILKSQVHCFKHKEPRARNGRSSRQGKHLRQPRSFNGSHRRCPFLYSKGLHREGKEQKETYCRRSAELRLQEVCSKHAADSFSGAHAVYCHTSSASNVHLKEVHYKKPS